MIKYLDELEKEDLQGKKVLLRLDLNVPIIDGEISDPYRIERAITTIDYLRDREAQIIIISHCEGEQSDSLVPMWNYLNGYFPVDFCSKYFTPEAIDKLLNLKDKGILLFENLRINPGEKENNKEFAKGLAQMADIFVNDAFSAMHRAHASIVGVPEFLPHYGGLLLRQELEHLSKVFNPAHPFLFILGGAKFDTKFPLVKKYLEKSDCVFVGGALANDIFKARGYETGTSLLSSGEFSVAEIMNNPKLIIPVDVATINSLGNIEIKKPDEVGKEEFITDCGPETIKLLEEKIKNSKTIVWNGPLGKYKKGFRDKSEKLAEILTQNTQGGAKAETIIGGGDTISSINMEELGHKFSFISTGGGAMLDYLVNETLPGIKALE